MTDTTNKSCAFCGGTDLHWKKFSDNTVRMANADGTMHYCEPATKPKPNKRCAFCGIEGLHWRRFGTGIFLSTSGGKRHVCEPVALISRTSAKPDSEPENE